MLAAEVLGPGTLLGAVLAVLQGLSTDLIKKKKKKKLLVQ